MRRNTRSSEQIPFDPEPERTLRRTRKLLKEVADSSTLAGSDHDSQSEGNYELENQNLSPPLSPPRQPRVTMSKMSTHSMPKSDSVPQGYIIPDLPASFDLKPGFLHLIEKNQFGGGAHEDPAVHIRNFVDYCGTVKHNNVTQDQIRDMYFRFSLRDEAREWISDLDREAEGITGWPSLALAFYQKYFPPEKTNMLRSQITSFKQHTTEDLSEAWERFKKLVKACPHHEFQQWFLVLQFHNGLYNESRAILDAACGGRFASNVNDAEAWRTIEEMAQHTKQYGRPRNEKPATRYEKAGVNSVSSIGEQVATAVAAEMASLHASLNKRFDDMELKVGQGSSYPVHAMNQEVEMCNTCGLEGHHATECQESAETVNYFQAWREKNQPWLNQPGVDKSLLNWTSRNVENPPQMPTKPNAYVPPHRTYTGPNTGNYQRQPYYLKPNQPPINRTSYQPVKDPREGPSMSDFEALKAQMAELAAHNKMLEHQLAQSTGSSKRQPGTFPSQGKLPNETVSAITLRSGAQYDGPAMPSDTEPPNAEIGEVDDQFPADYEKKDEVSGPDSEVDRLFPKVDRLSAQKESVSSGKPKVHQLLKNSTNFEKSRSTSQKVDRLLSPTSEKGKESEEGGQKVTPTKPLILPLPFPSRQRDAKLETQFNKFMEVVKNLQVTVPFTELVSQVPAYAKFLKDVLTKKRSLLSLETIAYTGESKHLSHGISATKRPDPGSFSLSCTIGTYVIDKALCDLGASVSVMPYSVYAKLNMGALKCTTITLQMADRSIKRPLGVLEDVPVKIGKFFIPVDFVIMDIAEDTHIPIILGRPFLNTAGAIIDVRNGRLTLEVGEEMVVFNLDKALKNPMIDASLCFIDIIDCAVADVWPESFMKDPLEALLCLNALAGEASMHVVLINALEAALEGKALTELQHARITDSMHTSYAITAKKPELKPLPSTLKYAFIDDNEMYPVIVNASLSQD